MPMVTSSTSGYPTSNKARYAWLVLLAMLLGSLWVAPPVLASERQASQIGAHGLRLPASLTGTLPCADCEGIRHHLDLWPDQAYHLRREWLAGDDATQSERDEIGRWHVDTTRSVIVLTGTGEMPLRWEILDASTIRQLDMQGNRIESDLPYELVSTEDFAPTGLSGVLASGMVTKADATYFFEACATGRADPIAPEAGFAALAQAHDANADPAGAPLHVLIEAGFAQRAGSDDRANQSVIVERFIRVRDEPDCGRAANAPNLIDGFWRLVRVGETDLGAVAGRREPHLLLDSLGGFRATVGCNSMSGSYRIDRGAIGFSNVLMTRMGCPPPLGAIENAFVAVLGDRVHWDIVGQTLNLRDDDGAILAELIAVYRP